MAKTLDEAGVKRLIQEIKGANKNLNTAIPISTENTTESKAQNVKNIADYVEKAKAAGIANVNGMGVTCLIDDEYSGVGYLYSYNGGPIWVTGIITYDDTATSPTAFFVDNEGLYNKRDVVIKDLSDQVTSDMLVEGARKPIILTPSTTEVDEETYQKLLSDNVDVVFKDIYNASEMALKEIDSDKNIRMLFSVAICAENIIGEGVDVMVIQQYVVEISSASPHSVVTEGPVSLEIEPKQCVTKSILSPVLQEIDLTGTDADRKAKLDKFETDWKALTGASHLAGARFVGLIDNGGGAQCLLSYNEHSGYYSGISAETADLETLIKIQVSPYTGSIITTPLFSHLEAITIKTGNTPDDKAANVAAIKAYVDNIVNLGVASEKGCIIPVIYIEEQQEYYGSLFYKKDTSGLMGIVSKKLGMGYYNLSVDKNDGSTSFDVEDPVIFDSSLSPIKESIEFLATCVNFTDTPSSNKILLELYLDTVPNATVMHCTYKDVYAGTLYKINNDWYGLLVKNTNNPADNINIKLSADGTITEGNSAQ